jgi:Uncharacterized protein conserved in bacteria (DUF2313).
MQALNYLPPILQEIKEFKVITSCDDTENSELNICIDNLYNDQFITTTETAIKKYEDILGITAKGTDTLKDRRFRVLALYNKQLPYTKTILEKNLITFCGKNGYKLLIDYDNKILTVKITLTAKSIFDTVQSYLEGVIPMDLRINLSLLYNQHLTLKQFTHAHLSQYTYGGLREEVLS